LAEASAIVTGLEIERRGAPGFPGRRAACRRDASVDLDRQGRKLYVATVSAIPKTSASRIPQIRSRTVADFSSCFLDAKTGAAKKRKLLYVYVTTASSVKSGGGVA
jgi:hypothetical protein